MTIQDLISSIKEGKEEIIKEAFNKIAFASLNKKLEEKKKEIAKALFKKKESS